MSIKNANRFTTEIRKYETLIEQLVEQRNKDNLKNVEEINNVIAHSNKNI